MTDVVDSADESIRPGRPLPPGPSMGLPRQLIYYLIVGGITVVVDIGLLAFLHEVYGVPLGVATSVAYCAAVAVNFLLNRTAMASRGSRGLTQHAWRYGALVLANYLITLAVVTAADHESAWYLVAKTAVVAASTSWNFLLYRYWIFATPRPPSSRREQGASTEKRADGRADGAGEWTEPVLVAVPADHEEESGSSRGDLGDHGDDQLGGPGVAAYRESGHERQA